MDNVIKMPQILPLMRQGGQDQAPRSAAKARIARGGESSVAPEGTLRKANIVLEALNMSLGVQFEIEKGGKVKVLIYDSESGQVIRQLPFKALEDTIDQVKDTIGRRLDLRI
jgi:uncharacterized FlaG/YvyC family protein